MENEVVLRFEGLEQEGACQEIAQYIQKMPGIEYVDVHPSGRVTVVGGDIDQLGLEDDIEAMGYPLLR